MATFVDGKPFQAQVTLGATEYSSQIGARSVRPWSAVAVAVQMHDPVWVIRREGLFIVTDEADHSGVMFGSSIVASHSESPYPFPSTGISLFHS